MSIPERWRAGTAECPLCSGSSKLHAIVEDVPYFDCGGCDFIFADPRFLDRVDRGDPVRQYDQDYWATEVLSARTRSFGSSLARVAEAVLYTRVPIERFIDIGTGPGYLLDSLALYLPQNATRFFGVEKFPPPEEERTRHPNYRCSDLGELEESFQCGVCVEVLEHLTPTMARRLAVSLAKVSVDGSLFLFNTGLTDYVKREDPGYLDPYRRGHITCWSVKSARKIFEQSGFRVHQLRGKSWAFVVEYGSNDGYTPIEDRIWSAPDCNKKLLQDDTMGTVMYILGLESARAY